VFAVIRYIDSLPFGARVERQRILLLSVPVPVPLRRAGASVACAADRAAATTRYRHCLRLRGVCGAA
jgi:hypothetical protein